MKTNIIKQIKPYLAICLGVIIASGIYFAIDDEENYPKKNQSMQSIDPFALINRPYIQHLSHSLQSLHLTEEQTLKVRDIILSARSTVKIYVKGAAADKKALKSLWDEQYDSNVIAAIADKQGQLVSQTIQLRLHALEEMYKVLTPEQQVKFEKLMCLCP